MAFHHIVIRESIAVSETTGTRRERGLKHRKTEDLGQLKLSEFLRYSEKKVVPNTPNIWLHPDFIDGDQEGDSWLFDINHMPNGLRSKVMAFLEDLAWGRELFGRNKPSSPIGRDGSNLNPGLEGCWHCHIGPFDENRKRPGTGYGNLALAHSVGLTSGAILHYTPSGDASKFTIIGAADMHIPFKATQVMADEDEGYKKLKLMRGAIRGEEHSQNE